MPCLGKSGTSRISFFSGSQLGLDRCGAEFDIYQAPSMRKLLRPATGLASASSTSSTRAFAQTRPQAEQLIVRAYGQNFNASIGVVTHPAGDAENMRLAFHEPAKAHTLYPSANEETAGLRGLFSGSHFVPLATCHPSEVAASLRNSHGGEEPAPGEVEQSPYKPNRQLAASGVVPKGPKKTDHPV